MKEIQEMWDGDTYPVFQFQLKAGGAVRDLTNHAAWFDIWKDGAFLVRRPGAIAGSKADGTVECFLRGFETDWGGSGARLQVYPTIMVPESNSGGSAINILENPSFDTYGGSTPTQLATSWTVVGTQTVSVYEVANTGPKPAFISGRYQSVVRSPTGGSDQLRQLVTGQAGVPGDYVTFGVWARGETILGTENNNNSIRLIFADGTVDNATLQLPVGTFDWTFFTVDRLIRSAQTSIDSRIVTHGNVGTWQFDDACTFFGRYKTLRPTPCRVIVRSRLRVPRTTNQIQGIGSFEKDSDSDGLPDGWMKSSMGFSPTLTMEKNPANVHAGLASLKAVCAGGADSPHIKTAIRGKFLAGETYRGRLEAKTSGTLTGTAPFIQLRTERFNTGQELSTPTSITQTLASFTPFQTDLMLTTNTDLLEFRVEFGDAAGTLWLDEVELYKV